MKESESKQKDALWELIETLLVGSMAWVSPVFHLARMDEGSRGSECMLAPKILPFDCKLLWEAVQKQSLGSRYMSNSAWVLKYPEPLLVLVILCLYLRKELVVLLEREFLEITRMGFVLHHQLG